VAKLTTEHKRAIVQRLAMFATPAEVQTALREEFSVEVTASQVLYYDPAASPDLAREWRELFAAIRERVVRETGDVAIAHRSMRLRWLERLARKAEQMGNVALAKELLEQAAKEQGDVFTNKRESKVTGFTLEDLIRGAASESDHGSDRARDGDGSDSQ
jgi:hypothetical protein